jgi:hypothetical protein
MQDHTHNSAHKERGNQESEYYQKGYDYQTQVLNRKLDQHVIDSPEAVANHSQQSQLTSANPSQEQKTGTAQQVSQQATQSNSQANSNSKDQAQKFNQVQRDYGISY